MEFKLPFPTLQDLAVHEIAHSLMDLEVTNRTWAKLLHESLSKVDKLEVLNDQKCRIREVIKGTQDHLRKWYTSHRLTLDKYNAKPKFHFDVHGRVDEVRMARDFLQKCHSNEQCDTDLWALQHLLYVASYYVLLPDIQEILPKFLKLHVKDSPLPLLDGPKFEVDTDEKLCLVYKFVDQQGLPMSLNVDYSDQPHVFPTVCVSNSCVRITLNRFFYNSETFQIHWNLLEESKRIRFFKKRILDLPTHNLVHQVFNILHFLDPDSRRCILDTIQDEWKNYKVFCCLLVWPYQAFFLPAFQLKKEMGIIPVRLFSVIVDKLDIDAFRDLLIPFFEMMPVTSLFKMSVIRDEPDRVFNNRIVPHEFKEALRKLSLANAPLYEIVSTHLTVAPFVLQYARNTGLYNDSSSSDSDNSSSDSDV